MSKNGITIEIYKMNFKLAEPIAISFHTFYYRENVLVKLVWNGIEGLGEAAPFKPITGDSQEDVIKSLETLNLAGINPETVTLDDFAAYLDTHIKGQTTKCALDFAYHDLVGKIKGVPIYKLYTDSPQLIPNSVTVFIRNPEATKKETQRLLTLYPHLQVLKIKLKGKDDLERVKVIKEACPPDLKFILDANQGFSDPRKAVSDLNAIVAILKNVILIEEPCPKGDLDKLKYVTDHIQGAYIFADESAVDYQDVEKIVKKQAAHGINIKLQKAGGITLGKKLAQLAKKGGLKVMVGSMLEGPVAITCGVHFGVSTENVILTDLDMDLDLPRHQRGEALFQDGQRIPTEFPGHGVTFDEKMIIKLAQTHNLVFERLL
ncbi:MAG: dipeptide epimerase [Patescibacteria group bacterium]